MLFGNQEFIKKVLKDVKKFEAENNFKTIYGAMVGSISKGYQNIDSDYDTRFLYIEDEFPRKINQPLYMKEIDIVKRYYPDEDEIYEWIPCWELTSFLQYLVCPAIDGRISNGLYNVVAWTMLSPYVWDPYGLQLKIVPLMNSILRVDYLVQYHIEQIEKYHVKTDKILLKDYIYALYSAVAIEWIGERKSFPPVYGESLLSVIQNEIIVKEIKLLISLLDKEIKAFESGRLHGSHFKVYTQHNIVLDNYIQNMKLRGRMEIKEFDDKKDAVADKAQKVVNNMYEIIYKSMNENKVKGVS